MILGSGDIGSILIDRPDVLFFACGVSNSKETHSEPYQKELRLLMSQPKDIHLVYFSSLCIYYSNSEYARHKRIMENTIKNHFFGYTIVRIGNIMWGKNPNTFLNYMMAHPEAPVLEVFRYLVSKEEFLHWVSLIPVPGKNEMNIPGLRVWVPDYIKSLQDERVHW